MSDRADLYHYVTATVDGRGAYVKASMSADVHGNDRHLKGRAMPYFISMGSAVDNVRVHSGPFVRGISDP